MKANKMTNEQIADAIEVAFCASSSPFGATMREAAARLRAFSTLTTHTDNSEVIAELQRRLKVTEEALTAIMEDQDYLGWHNPVNISRSALAAIRGEGGAV